MSKESHSIRHKTTKNKRETVDKTFWDTDFFEDEGIVALEMEFGDAAPAYYMRIAFMILRNGGPIERRVVVHRLSKATSLTPESIEKLIELCEVYNLLIVSNGLLSSKRAEQEIHNLSEQREVWRDEKKLQRERAKALRLKALKELNVHPDICPEVHPDVHPESIREGKGKEGKGIILKEEGNEAPKKKREKPGPITQEFKQYGKKFLRMSPESMKKLVDEFGRDNVIKALPDADHWIASDGGSKAAQYRGPRHDHYLFFKGWLKRNTGLSGGSVTGIRTRVEPKLVHPPIFTPPKPEPPADPEAVKQFKNDVAKLVAMKSIPALKN
jgi:hypothetical protein